ncbi:hypothetical protein [Streptomyces sp. NPDC020996]|uniref:hypothetical protein n=1 Tax=Streptomyces sp. NPDC020996 TaxID=3154791 RepID=UPI0033EA5C86
MTALVRVCRACDEPVEDPDDAVYVGHTMANSGPGWPIWAHRAHVGLLRPGAGAVRVLARVPGRL